MSNIYGDKLNVPAHPLVDKLNANQSARSSYWLTFVLYAKVEEKDLETKLLELGKSLKLDDAVLQEELSAVTMCSSDEDFESLVKECISGLSDQNIKIFLFIELDQFGEGNGLNQDFPSELMSIMGITEEIKNFVKELKKIITSSSADLLSFYDLTKKYPDVPVCVYETFTPDLWEQCRRDFSTEASELIQIISNNFSKDRFWDNMDGFVEEISENECLEKFKSFPILCKMMTETGQDLSVVAFWANQKNEMEKEYNTIKSVFNNSHKNVPLPLVNRHVFLQYKEKQHTLFAAINSYLDIAESGDGGFFEFKDKIHEIFGLRWYMRFSVGIKGDFFEHICRFHVFDDLRVNYADIPGTLGARFLLGRTDEERSSAMKEYQRKCQAAQDEARQIAKEELASIISEYEEENEKLSEFFI